MALLLAEQIDATGQSAPHKMLTLMGVRRPWMPSPLQGEPDRLVRGALAVAVAVTIAFPPAGMLWMPRPIGEGVVIPQERLAPTTLHFGQQRTNQGWLWQFAPIREQPAAPAERLAPLTLTLGQQPRNTGYVALGRLLRDEDTTRPARPMALLLGQQPVPGGLLSGLTWPHKDTPPIQWPITKLLFGQQPIPPGQVVFTSVISKDSPPIQWPLTRLTFGQQPINAGVVQFTSIIPKDAPPIQWPITRLLFGQQPANLGRVSLTVSIRDELIVAADRLAPTILLFGQQPMPAGQALWLRSLNEPVVVADRFSPLILQFGQQPTNQGWLWRPSGLRVEADTLPVSKVLFLFGQQPFSAGMVQMQWPRFTEPVVDTGRVLPLRLLIQRNNPLPPAAITQWLAGGRPSAPLVDLFPTWLHQPMAMATIYLMDVEPTLYLPVRMATLIDPETINTIYQPLPDATLSRSDD